jgi:hypothetical protein
MLKPPAIQLNKRDTKRARYAFSILFGVEGNETFEKCSILFEFKEDEGFNHRNTLSISRIKI